jgi:hypothetical protein
MVWKQIEMISYGIDVVVTGVVAAFEVVVPVYFYKQNKNRIKR